MTSPCTPSRPRTTAGLGYPHPGYPRVCRDVDNGIMNPSELGTLGEFLAASRARLSPAQSLELGSTRRRVPGSRREEIAALAGVSASYYARLEQGQVTTAS